MKKIICALLLTILLSGRSLATQLDMEVNEKIASIGFGKLFAADPQEQLTKLFENYTKYGNKHNLEKIKQFYDEKYVNADGFSYDTYFKLVNKTWDLYPDMKYTMDIQSIVVNGDYAIVQTKESAQGTETTTSEYLEDKGCIENSSEVVYYLKKYGNKWKIISDSIISEKTFVKYGEAKEVAFDVVAPGMIAAGEEYTVLFAAELPKDKILLGSITNEKITYPNERQKEVFRKLKEDGILERVVRANNEGYNEQAVVSVGITKTEINEEKDLKLSVSGVAFLITRVNVVQPKKFEFGLKIDEEETKKL